MVRRLSRKLPHLVAEGRIRVVSALVVENRTANGVTEVATGMAG
tara:strand:- start:466 stop:597 length:132 start_codon:yes stop_codon:yes gene_type:complete